MPDGKRIPMFRRRVNVDSLNASPLADSLRQVMPRFGVQEMTGDDWQRQGVAPNRSYRGVAFRGDPIVRINPIGQMGQREAGDLPSAAADERRPHDVRSVLLHEAGHVAQERAGNPRFLTFARQFDIDSDRQLQVARKNMPPTSNATRRAERRERATPEELALVNLNPYAADDLSGNEGYAQAFAGAWDYLSRTAGQPTEAPRQLLAEYEARVPGTGTLVMELLKEDVFRNHPYARGFQPATEQARR